MENKQSFYGGGSKSFYGVINSYGDINNLYEEKTITGPVNIVSFNDGLKNKKIKQLIVAVKPQQDLHGYDNPWPGGGGKNKLPKEYSTQTINDVTFTVYDDGSIKVNGTASARVDYYLSGNSSGGSLTLPSGNYIINYGSASLSTSGLYMQYQKSGVTTTIDRSSTFEASELGFIRLIITNVGAVINNVMIYPMIRLSSVADDTYSPYSNVCPISGFTAARVTRTGKNLLDTSDISDYTKWSATVAPGGDMGSTTVNRIYSLPKIKGGVQYTISFGVTAASFPSYLYFGYYKDGITTKIKNVTTEGVSNPVITFTAIEGVTYCLRMGSTLNESDFEGQIAKLAYIQLELGSTATAYSPYAGQVYDIAFPSEAGTVYGGSLNVTTGVLTVDRATVTIDGNSTFGNNGIQQYGGLEVSYTPNPERKPAPSQSTQNEGLISNLFTSRVYGGVEFTITGRSTNKNIYLNMPTTITTVDGAKSWFAENNTQISYLLDTPQTYQLTPTQIATLLGDNNIWADAGSIQKLTYIAKK